MTKRGFLLTCIVFALLVAGRMFPQQQQSGGAGSAVSATQSGTWNITNVSGTVSLPTGAATAAKQPALGTAGSASADVISVQGVASMTALKVDGSGVTQPVSGTVSVNAIPAGSNIIGYVRVIPPGCSGQSTPQQFTVAQATNGAGSTLTSTTSCVISCYANNITNSAVTVRLADKAGTPVIWLGGNADFSVPANSNIRLPLAEGIVFTSGITVIAGTTSALNVACSTYQ
jgi:hypothetical protein